MSAPVLEAEHVTKRFGGLTALADFSLTLAPGELVGLIGPNGAGKTTVFNLLTGVYRPDAGRIAVCGRDIRRLAPDRIAGLGAARTFQNLRLFRDLSVLDNVRVGATLRSRAGLWAAAWHTHAYRENEARVTALARELLAEVGLADAAEQPAKSLPYGAQRRLEIARALATGPRVLLLDEPAAGANDSESAALQELIRRLAERLGLAMLIIEHDMPFVMGLASRVLVLDSGATIAVGPPGKIQSSTLVIRAYLGTDKKG